MEVSEIIHDNGTEWVYAALEDERLYLIPLKMDNMDKMDNINNLVD